MDRVSERDGVAASAHPAATVAAWCAVALVVMVPLAFWPPAFGPFHAAKWLAVCVVVSAGLGAAAVAGILRWPRWRWFVPLIVVSLAATVLGVAPWMSLLGSPNRNAGLLALALGAGAFVLGASVAADTVAQRRVLRAAVLTAAVVGMSAVAERLGLDIAGLGDAGDVTRGRSTWGSATFAGAHLVMLLPAAVALVGSRDPRWRTVAVVSSVAIAAGLVATGTRAAWLAAVVAAVLFGPAARRAFGAAERSTADGSPGRGPRPPRASGDGHGPWVGSVGRVALVVGVLIAVVAVGLAVAPQIGRSSAVGRLELWSTTPSVIAERPLLGSGPDTQRVVLPAGADPAFERAHGSEELHDRAHSLPLDTLVTTGVLGLVALGALLWVLGRDITTHAQGQLVPNAVGAGLAAYLVTLLFAFGDPVIDPIAWLLAGVVWVGAVPPERSAAPGPGGRRARVAAAVAFGVVTVGGAAWAGGEVLAEVRLQRALEAGERGDLDTALDELDAAAAAAPARFDLHQAAARLVTGALVGGEQLPGGEPARRSLVVEASDHLDRAQRIGGPRDPDLLMDRADLLAAAGDPRAALELYGPILDAYPHSSRAHLGLGLVRSQLGDPDGAEDAWRRSADLAPGDPRPLVNLGILAERRGDPDEAADMFRAALAVDPADTDASAGLDRVVDPTA